MTAAQIGSAGEAMTAAEFMRLGIPVYLPVGDEGVDLVADFGGRPQRIQVKTTAGTAAVLNFRLEHRAGCRVSPSGWALYAPGRVDWFALCSLTHGRVALVRPDIGARCSVAFAASRHAGRAFGVEDYDIGAVVARISEEASESVPEETGDGDNSEERS